MQSTKCFDFYILAPEKIIFNIPVPTLSLVGNYGGKGHKFLLKDALEMRNDMNEKYDHLHFACPPFIYSITWHIILSCLCFQVQTNPLLTSSMTNHRKTWISGCLLVCIDEIFLVCHTKWL